MSQLIWWVIVSWYWKDIELVGDISNIVLMIYLIYCRFKPLLCYVWWLTNMAHLILTVRLIKEEDKIYIYIWRKKISRRKKTKQKQQKVPQIPVFRKGPNFQNGIIMHWTYTSHNKTTNPEKINLARILPISLLKIHLDSAQIFTKISLAEESVTLLYMFIF